MLKERTETWYDQNRTCRKICFYGTSRILQGQTFPRANFQNLLLYLKTADIYLLWWSLSIESSHISGAACSKYWDNIWAGQKIAGSTNSSCALQNHMSNICMNGTANSSENLYNQHIIEACVDKLSETMKSMVQLPVDTSTLDKYYHYCSWVMV